MNTDYNLYTTLNSQEHKKLCFLTDFNPIVLQNEQIIPIVTSEFVTVAAQNPIVFVKENQTGKFKAVALYGLKSGENLDVKDGHWQALYLPLATRNKFFKLVEDAQKAGQYHLACRLAMDAFQFESGVRLLDENGTETDFTQQVKASLQDYLQQQKITEAFFELLAELDLLSPQTLSVNTSRKTYKIEGIYCIDEERLNELAGEEIARLQQANVLTTVYAHIVSKAHVLTLAAKKDKQDSDQEEA